MSTVANLPPVSTTLAVFVANFPPVSMIPVDLKISPRIFEKVGNDPNDIIRGLGEDDSRKKAKNLVTLSL